MRRPNLFAMTIVAFLAVTLSSNLQAAEQPGAGDKAADFTLSTPDGTGVTLSGLLKEGPAVVVVLRGYPGYQCPICTRQVGSLTAKAKEFADAGTNVILVYPGPVGELKEKANEFMDASTLPENFHFVLDPGYEFTTAWGLRWDAERETAYPSVFVVGKDGLVKFAHISTSHGNRAKTEDVLKAIE